MKAIRHRGICAVAVLGIAQALAPASALAAWEPTRPVEFIIPAGTGGGADQMARTIQGIVTKHGLMKQPLVVINKAGGAGGEGFLDVKASRGNPHKIIITLSNLFTTPLATGIPFNWKDLTPVAMLALDEFVLWVNAEKPYKTAKEYIERRQGRERHVQDGRGFVAPAQRARRVQRDEALREDREPRARRRRPRGGGPRPSRSCPPRPGSPAWPGSRLPEPCQTTSSRTPCGGRGPSLRHRRAPGALAASRSAAARASGRASASR